MNDVARDKDGRKLVVGQRIQRITHELQPAILDEDGNVLRKAKTYTRFSGGRITEVEDPSEQHPSGVVHAIEFYSCNRRTLSAHEVKVASGQSKAEEITMCLLEQNHHIRQPRKLRHGKWRH